MKYWGWPLYFMLVGLMLLVAFFSTVSPSVLGLVSEFTMKNKEVLWSLGTLFLVAFLTLVTTGIANASSDAQKKADRITAAEIEIAKFRQAWIDNLRKLLAQVIHLSSEVVSANRDEFHFKEFSKLHELHVQIKLMLNPKEIKAIALSKQVEATIITAERTQLMASNSISALPVEEKFYEARDRLAKISAEYLKAEWEVTKSVLKNAKRDWT